MFCLIAGEAAIFTIFVVAYIFYIGKSLSGPMPRQVLEIPIITTICLLSSSLTIHFAVRALQRGNIGSFKIFWFITLALGAIFLIGTGREWHHLIYEKGLTRLVFVVFPRATHRCSRRTAAMRAAIASQGKKLR